MKLAGGSMATQQPLPFSPTTHPLTSNQLSSHWALLPYTAHNAHLPPAMLALSRKQVRRTSPQRRSRHQSAAAAQVALGDAAAQSTEFFPLDGDVEEYEPMERSGRSLRYQKGRRNSGQLAYDPEFIKMIAMVPRNDGAKVVSHIKAWLAEGKPLTKQCVVAAIIKLRRVKRISDALAVSEWIATEKLFELDEMDALSRIDLTARSGDLDGAEKLFQELPPHHKTERAYNTLLACYCYSNLVEKAEKLMEFMREANLCSSVFTYNNMMSLYLRKGLLDKLSSLLKELNSRGTEPDIFTYNLLINFKSRSGDIEAVEKLMDDLRANPLVSPNGATYTLLANAYISADMKEKAEAILKEMEFSLDVGRIRRILISYETLLTMYGTLGKLDGLERVWLHLNAAPKRSTASYVCMIEALGRIGEVDKAETIFMQRKQENQIIGIRLYNAMLSAYSREGLMRKAEALIRELQGRGLTLDSLSYYHIIKGYLNSNEEDNALKVIREVKEIPEQKRPKLWYSSCLTLLQILCEKGDLIKAKNYFEDLRTHADKDVRLYNSLLKAYVKAQMPVNGVLEEMVADGIKPNEETEQILKQSECLPRRTSMHDFCTT